ncbi:MAG: cysteine hydrolase [Alicyclobacillus sp.]|nr:cysteine hydrolase [Alicyclobacillus sp.]
MPADEGVFDPARAALLVIDMQNAFLQEDYAAYVPAALATVAPINTLVAACRQAGVEVIWTQHVLRPDLSDRGLLPEAIAAGIREGTPGVELYAGMAVEPGDKRVRKRRFSAFYGTDLEAYLRQRNIDQLVIVGTVLNVCCECTARDAFQRDFRVWMPVELNTTRHHPDLGWGAYTAEAMAQAVFTSLANKFVTLVHTETLVGLLQQASLAQGGV